MKGVCVFGSRVKTITASELAERLVAGGSTLIDVREPYEFAAGHVPGAVNIPLGALGGAVANLDAGRDTLVICQSGRRSVTGARVLMKAGFSAVRSVAGGTTAWKGRLER